MVQGPLQHHRARGIHPGAFVQSAPPATAGMQDGVLWVDTSSGPPFALKVWNQGLGVWRAVGMTGVTGTPGAGLPGGDTGDILVNIAGEWMILRPGTLGQDLVLQPDGDGLVPRWSDPCCGTDLPTKTPADKGDTTINLTSRCGAAVRMATWLEQYYANVRGALVYGLGAFLGWSLAGIVDALGEMATDGLATPWLVISQGALVKAGQLIVGFALVGTIADVMPVLTTDDNNAILKACYLTLPTDPGPITVTATSLANWGTEIKAATMPAGPLMQQLLALLIPALSLGSWQQLAFFGSLNNPPICAGWPLTGNAIRGGAMVGSGIARSIRGGATLGIVYARSIQGGAALGAVNGQAMQGGAS